MPDPDGSLREDVDVVRSCELLPREVGVEGWRYRVESGEIVRFTSLPRSGPRPLGRQEVMPGVTPTGWDVWDRA